MADKVIKAKEHKVKDGESLASLAVPPITWQDIAILNFGSADPDKINIGLRSKVGCTKKTADGNNYIFSSSDKPGIILIPETIPEKEFPTNTTHEIKVKTPPLPTCFITSETEVKSPADRTRTKLGVGELVKLSYAPEGSTKWSVSGAGSIDDQAGADALFNAGETAGTATVTASGVWGDCSITFTIVAPTHLTMHRKSGTVLKHTNGIPDCGWFGTAFAHPDDVNFYRVEVREKDSQAVGTGSFSGLTGVRHGKYTLPDEGGGENVSVWIPLLGSKHSDADGTPMGGHDKIYARSGAAGTEPPFNTGTLYMPITWQWRVLGKTRVTSFPTFPQQHEIAADGTCHSNKGGNSESAFYSDKSSEPSGWEPSFWDKLMKALF